MAIHNGIILAQENHDLRRFNEKKRRKRQRSNRQIVGKQGLTTAEAHGLDSNEQSGEEAGVQVVEQVVEQVIMPSEAPNRRVFRCSGCNLVGHRINQCPNR